MLAGQSTPPSTLVTSTDPVLSDPAVRSGRRRGLTQLYSHLLHHAQHLPPQGPASPPPHPSRPQPSRSQSSPSPSSSSVAAQPRSVVGPLALSPTDPDHADSDTRSRTRAESRVHRPRMLPIVNTHPFVDSHSSVESTPLFGTSAPLAPVTSSRSDGAPGGSYAHLPSIQFIPASDPTRSRPSLDFKRITRVLPDPGAVIRVGRYSERDSASDANPHVPSDAPIGFKSKVVSRRHCEFSFSNNQWFVRDVKSSSGTFLNHIRLSQPGMESRLYPINDGDTVQLGIDFKGGEEMIFRCVKIRVETNRGWQRGLNKFNKSTHKQLQALARGRRKDSDTASKHSTDCTICLNSIAPCQALFVAPCSHTWHFKCIRKILEGSTSSQFLCPNCRAQADLDADVEDEELEDFESYDEEDINELIDEDDDELRDSASAPDEVPPSSGEEEQTSPGGSVPTSTAASPSPGPETSGTPANDRTWGLSAMPLRQSNMHLASLNDTINRIGRNHGHLDSLDDTINQIGRSGGGDGAAEVASNLNPAATTFTPPPSLSVSSPRPIPGATANGVSVPRARTNTTNTLNVAGSEVGDALSDLNLSSAASPSRGTNPLEGLVRDGPMTPRNTAGPFVFDGGAENNRPDQHSS